MHFKNARNLQKTIAGEGEKGKGEREGQRRETGVGLIFHI